MKKFFILISAFIFLCSESFCGTGSSNPAHPFSQALSTNDINYIFLKRRDERGQMPPLSRKRIFCIFAILDKMMGGNGLSEEKDLFWVDDDTEDEDLSEIYSSQETPDYIYEHLVSITNQITQSKMKNYTLAVFSETFFSNNPALDDVSVENIVKCCKILTKKHKDLIICVNFLHKYAKSSLPSWLSPGDFANPLRNDFICTTTARQNVDTYKQRLLSNKISDLRFSNYSLIIWDGIPLSCYRKTIYLKEQDSLADKGYGFDFGDWHNYSTKELSTGSLDHKKFANLFNTRDKQVVMTRICADLADMPDVPDSIKLLIAQANDAPSGWLEKFQVSTVCCYCDAAKGCMILKPQKNAQKINTCSFVENELHYTICEY